MALAHIKPELERYKRDAENSTIVGQRIPLEEDNKSEQSKFELSSPHSTQNSSPPTLDSESSLSSPESGGKEEEG